MSPCYAKMLSEHISFLCSILLEQRVVASRSKALNAWNSHHSSVSMYSFYMISITIIVQWLLFNRCWAIKSAKCKNSDSMQRFIVSISNLWFPSGSLLNAIIRIFCRHFDEFICMRVGSYWHFYACRILNRALLLCHLLTSTAVFA